MTISNERLAAPSSVEGNQPVVENGAANLVMKPSRFAMRVVAAAVTYAGCYAWAGAFYDAPILQAVLPPIVVYLFVVWALTPAGGRTKAADVMHVFLALGMAAWCAAGMVVAIMVSLLSTTDLDTGTAIPFWSAASQVDFWVNPVTGIVLVGAIALTGYVLDPRAP